MDMLEHFGGDGSLGPIMSLAGHIGQAGFAEDLPSEIQEFDFPTLHMYSRQQNRVEPHHALRPQVG